MPISIHCLFLYPTVLENLRFTNLIDRIPTVSRQQINKTNCRFLHTKRNSFGKQRSVTLSVTTSKVSHSSSVAKSQHWNDISCQALSMFLKWRRLCITTLTQATGQHSRKYFRRLLLCLLTLLAFLTVAFNSLDSQWRSASVAAELRYSRISDVVREPHFQYFLSACVIVRESSDLMGEFLVRNHAAGVDHFFIYGDDDDPSEMSRLQIIFNALQGVVTYIPHGRAAPTDKENPDNYVQMRMYRHCLQEFGPLSKWVALIDTDEFFETSSLPFSYRAAPSRLHRTFLHDVLSAHEMIPVLCVRWKTALTNGRLHPPRQGETLRNSFSQTCRSQVNNKEKLALRKMILQPHFVDMEASPKLDVAIHKGFSFKGDMKKLHCKWGLVHEVEPPIYLIHYWSRDLSSYLRKIHRGRPRRNVPVRNLGDLFLRESLCNLEENVRQLRVIAEHEQKIIEKLPFFPPSQEGLASPDLAIGNQTNSPFTFCKKRVSRLISEISAGNHFSNVAYCDHRESDACSKFHTVNHMSWPFPWAEYITNSDPMENEDGLFT